MEPKYPNQIRQIRKEKGMSGTALAKKLGISPQYFYDLEKGKRRLNDSLIKKLTRILGVSADRILASETTTDYLLGRTDDPQGYPSWWHRDTPPTDVELEEFLKTANVYFNGAPLDEEDKEDILTYLRVKWERERRKKEKEKLKKEDSHE